MTFHPLFGADVLTASETAVRKGIDNDIPAELLPNAKRLSRFLGEQNAAALGTWQAGLRVLSGYRCPALNIAVGGAKASDHMEALAADVMVPGVSAWELANRMQLWFEAYGVDWDQLIIEYGRWTHIAIPPEGKVGRRELLTAHKRSRKTVYLKGLVKDPK